MTGPREPTIGTIVGLFVSTGRCSFPRCEIPAMTVVDGEYYLNVEKAHIYGARPGSARYVESMEEEDRRSFNNLILLCQAHHQAVDGVRHADYPPELLLRWKAAAEEGSRLPREMSEADFTAQVEAFFERKYGAARTAAVELAPALASGSVVMTASTFEEVTEMERQLPDGTEQIILVTIRNTGAESLTVEGITLLYSGRARARPNDPEVDAMLMGRNDFPLLNPRLGEQVSAGEAIHWRVALSTVGFTVAAAPQAVFSSIRARVALGSGEVLESGRIPWPWPDEP